MPFRHYQNRGFYCAELKPSFDALERRQIAIYLTTEPALIPGDILKIQDLIRAGPVEVAEVLMNRCLRLKGLSRSRMGDYNFTVQHE